MNTIQVIQANLEDLRQLTVEAYIEGYRRAKEEKKVIKTNTKKELANKLNTSVYKIERMLLNGQAKKTATGYECNC